MHFQVSVEGKTHDLELEQTSSGWSCRLDGRDIPVDVAQLGPGRISLLVAGRSYDVSRGASGSITVGERSYEVELTDPKSWRGRRGASAAASGPQNLTASMPGKVVRVLAQKGSKIHKGQGVLVIEAMKMQNEIRSPRDGIVSAVLVQEGASVNAGQALVRIE